MPPTTAQKNAITQFQAFTGTSDRTAASYMKKYGYNVSQAADAYFTASGSAPAQSTSAKSKQKLETLFDSLRDGDDDADTVTIDGTMKYFQDIGVNFEDASLFVALEAVKATTMGELEKTPFVNGWLEKGTAKPLDTVSSQSAYISTQKSLLATDTPLFKRIYRNIFLSAREKGAKALPLEDAMTHWKIIFAERPWTTPNVDWLTLWCEFLGDNWKKSVNKDMWNQTYEFYVKTLEDPTLGFWSEDSAWPGVIDEFVAWAKTRI